MRNIFLKCLALLMGLITACHVSAQGSVKFYSPKFAEKFETLTIKPDGPSELHLAIPESIKPEARLKILQLTREITDICPYCSTVGTLGVTTIKGEASTGNDLFSISRLRPLNDDMVLVPKKQYQELLQKEKVYDKIFGKN